MKDFQDMALVVESWEKATSKPEFEEQVSSLIFRQYVRWRCESQLVGAKLLTQDLASQPL